MTTPRLTRYDRWAWALLGLILLVRLPLALLATPPVVTDAQGYEAAAFRLAENGSFAYPLYSSSHWAFEDGRLVVTDAGRIAFLSDAPNAFTLPGYPAFRAPMVKAAAGSTYDSRVWTRLAQVILSVLSAGLIYLIGRRFGERTGLLALVLAIAYPPFSMANSYLQTEVLFTFLLLVSVYWFVKWSESLAWFDALAAGVAFGLSMWVRPAMSLWAPIAAALVVLSTRPQRTRAAVQAAGIGMAIVLVMTPWWVRNLQLYDTFVPFSTSGAITAIEAIRMDVAVQLPFPWQSKPPRQTPDQASIERLAVKALSQPRREAANDLELNAYYASALSTLRESILRDYRAATIASRLRSFAVSFFWPFAVSPTALGGIPFLVAWLLHLTLLVLFVCGVALAPRRTDTWLLVSLPVYTVLLHLFIIPFHRYYFPAMPAVAVIAAIGLDRLLVRAGIGVREDRPRATEPESVNLA